MTSEVFVTRTAAFLPFEPVNNDDMEAVLGMVGGKLYFRGPVQGLSKKDVKVGTLDAADIAYLSEGMDEFLREIERLEGVAGSLGLHRQGGAAEGAAAGGIDG